MKFAIYSSDATHTTRMAIHRTNENGTVDLGKEAKANEVLTPIRLADDPPAAPLAPGAVALFPLVTSCPVADKPTVGHCVIEVETEAPAAGKKSKA